MDCFFFQILPNDRVYNLIIKTYNFKDALNVKNKVRNRKEKQNKILHKKSIIFAIEAIAI